MATTSCRKPTNQSSRPHVRLFWFTSLIALSLVVGFSSLRSLIQITRDSSEYSYIIIVLPVSLALIYLERAEIFSTFKVKPYVGTSLAIIVALATLGLRRCLYSFSTEERLSFSVFLLVSFWISAFCISFGWKAARRAIFPLLFLYVLVPVPEAFMARTIIFLQHGSADAAALLFNIAGVPNLRDGQYFALANLQIEVARECSGIRSSIVLLITGLVFGHLFLRSVWTKALFVAAILPLAIFKNGLRIFTISVLAAYVDPGFLYGSLHRQGGVFFFTLALGVTLAFLLVLRKLERVTVVRHSGAEKANIPPLQLNEPASGIHADST